MKINPNSPLWAYPGEHVDMIFQKRFDACLQEYEDRLTDEYVECQIHINELDPSGQHIQWWVGSKDRIKMETAFFEEAYGVFDSFLKYTDMSAHCQEIYRNVTGHGEPVESSIKWH
jgi:hypothetical protein